MPLELKNILADHGITQHELAAAIVQRTGRRAGASFGHSAMSRILNGYWWPAATSVDDVKRQVEAYLRGRGVPEADIARAWNVDEADSARDRHPRGVHARAGNRLTASPYEADLPETEMLTPAARETFKLFRDPFIDDVQKPEDLYLGPDARYVREAMWQTAKHGGFLAVVGESGAGKTTLRRDLLDRIRRESAAIVAIQPRIIDKGRLTAGQICDAIVGDLSSERPRATLEAKARQIEALLTHSSRGGNSHVLIIEEAHDLTVQTLKFLKRFWELEDGFRKLLAIILVGQPELRAMLDERKNHAAREVIRRCEVAELRPLNGDLEAYLALKFKRIGADLAQVFTPDAIAAMRDKLMVRFLGSHDSVAMHYPLVVNNLAARSMNLAVEIGAAKVDGEVVRGVFGG